jgi:hypothetical protein
MDGTITLGEGVVVTGGDWTAPATLTGFDAKEIGSDRFYITLLINRQDMKSVDDVVKPVAEG